MRSSSPGRSRTIAIKAVFFDVYNTLAGFHPTREQIQATAAAAHGLHLTDEGTARGYHDADRFMSEQNGTRPVRSMDSEERLRFFAEYERRVLRGSGHDVDLETAGKVWAAVRQQEYGLQLFPDAVPTLDDLRAAGYRVGVISNMNQAGDRLARDLGLVGHVDVIVTSLEVGAEKPNAAIFREALKRAGVMPSEAVHVGDQIDSDIRGAELTGMHAVLVDRYAGHDGYSAHPRISGLAELPGLIEDWPG